MNWLLSASFSMMLSSFRTSSSLMRMDFEFSFSLLRSSRPFLRFIMLIAFLSRWLIDSSICLRLRPLFYRLARALLLVEWELSLGLCSCWLF